MGTQDRIGTLVAGRFRLDSLLGSGGLGQVYLARHEFLRRQVALKLLHRELLAELKVLAGFEREAMAASRIQSPHTPQVLDFGYADDGVPYMAMEYIQGRTLSAVVEQEGPLEVLRVLDLLTQIGRCLVSAHEAGVIHRDLKSKNVMLTASEGGQEHVMVLDFGLAKITDPQTITNLTSMGSIYLTPGYMAPEQSSGAEVDHRADLYSLGVVAYELLTARLPFVGPPMKVMQAHANQPPPALNEVCGRKDIPMVLESYLMSCLAKDPQQRPSTAAKLVQDLDAFSRIIGG